MIIENKGIQTDSFYIPPFDLKEGEIAVVFLFNGYHFSKTEIFLKNIYCGITKHKNVVIHKKLTFVENLEESRFRRIFFPLTVGEYLKKTADPKSDYATKIYENKWINKNTKIKTLGGNARKMLSLYSTLSKTNNIIFDLVGQDPSGAEETYKLVKEAVLNGGSAILLDNHQDMQNDCTKFIELKWLKEV